MSALAIMVRPGRRTHLMGPDHRPFCGTHTALTGAVYTPVDIAGGTTPRLMADLSRELGENTCLRCTRMAALVMVLYAVRDTGKAMRTW